MEATRARFLRLRNMANLRSGRTNCRFFFKFLWTGKRERQDKSRRWSLEKPPWICSLKNASVAYIFPILWQSSSHEAFNCHIKFWSRWLGCKSRQLSITIPLFAGKVGGSILKASSRFFSRLPAVNKNPCWTQGSLHLYSVLTYTKICFTETKSIGKVSLTNILTWTRNIFVVVKLFIP